jgi:hypothetical protein
VVERAAARVFAIDFHPANRILRLLDGGMLVLVLRVFGRHDVAPWL